MLDKLIPHWKYFLYLLRHKWYVCVACFKVKLYWQGIIHDWTKIRPCEWFPYVDHFYGKCQQVDIKYDEAWLHHIHNNRHHHEHWIIPSQGVADEKNGMFKPHNAVLPMPHRYVLEMICDWWGAGKAQGVNDTTLDWYRKNRYNMILHSDSRELLERLLDEMTWLTE